MKDLYDHISIHWLNIGYLKAVTGSLLMFVCLFVCWLVGRLFGVFVRSFVRSFVDEHVVICTYAYCYDWFKIFNHDLYIFDLNKCSLCSKKSLNLDLSM